MALIFKSARRLFNDMDINKRHLLWVSIFLLAGFMAFLFFGSNATGKYDDFAKCLTENGVKMYGAYWCPHCLNQKSMFGSSWKYVNNIECSLPNRGGQTDLCNKASIKGYPTWEFADKTRLEGEVSFEYLSEKSGCELV